MPIIIITISWLFGIWLASTQQPVPLTVWLLIGGVGAISGAALYRWSPRVGLILLGIGALTLGGARYLHAQPDFDENHVVSYLDQRDITLVGTIIDEPDIRDRQINYRVRPELLILRDGTEIEAEGDLLVQTPRFPVLDYGSTIEISGNLDTPFENQEFSYKDYLNRQGIYGVVSWPRILDVTPDQGRPFYHTLFRVKTSAFDTLNRLVPAPESGLLTGILLGYDHTLPPDIVDDFRATGITHIVVISGFNIAILASIFLTLATPFFGKRNAAFVAIIGIILYTLLVGADAAVVRAAIMGSLYVIGERFLGQKNMTVAVLFVAALIMTGFNPNILWDVGFQLSFAATLSILLYAEPLTFWTKFQLSRVLSHGTVEKIIGFLTEALLVTIAAQILTLPLMMYYFQQVSLVSLLANFFILPAQPGIMLWGGLALLLGSAIYPLGVPFAWVATAFLWYTIQAARLFARIPFALVPVSFTLYSLVVVYLAIGMLTWYGMQENEDRALIWEQVRFNFGRRLLIGLSLIGLLLGWRWVSSRPDGYLHIITFDVGQGDAMLIQSPTGRQILVDGGYYPTRLNRHMGENMPFGDREIDVVIASHPDADHITGLPGIFDRYTVNQLVVAYTAEEAESETYQALLEAAAEQGTQLHRVTAGEILVIDDGVQLEFVHPGPDLLADSRNDNSVSFRLVYEDMTLLFTGDAEEAGEQAMLRSGLPLQAMIYKAGHHGANNASSDAFLAAVRPQIAIISSGEDNRFGHPHPETLDRLNAAGASVLRTDQLGTIAIISDGHQVWFESRR